VSPVFQVLLAVAVKSSVVSLGLDVGYTVTTPELDPGSTAGMLAAAFHVLSPLSSNGEAMASLGASLLALVSVLVAP
jgi:hypothetical protein